MRTTAQNRIGRGPLGALLILLSLLVGSGGAAAGADLRQSARLSPSRQPASVVLLPSGLRNALDDDSPAAGHGPAAPPSKTAIATDRLPARPAAEPFAATAGPALSGPAAAPYRARAPPAA